MDRNREIIKRRKAGETLQSIGLSYGITKQRVSAIVKRHNSNRPKPLLLRILGRLRGMAKDDKSATSPAKPETGCNRCPECGALTDTSVQFRRRR